GTMAKTAPVITPSRHQRGDARHGRTRTPARIDARNPAAVRNMAGKRGAKAQAYPPRGRKKVGSPAWDCHHKPQRAGPPRQKRGALYHSKSHQLPIETRATSTPSRRWVVR